VLEARFVGFQMRRELSTQLKKAGLGLAIAALLLYVCGMANGVSWMVHAVAGLWVSLGAPWVFKKLGWG
jgi:hypothetical protein